LEVQVDRRVQGKASVHTTADVGDPRVDFADDVTILNGNRVFEIEKLDVFSGDFVDLYRFQK
jgi:hypothetical protein